MIEQKHLDAYAAHLTNDYNRWNEGAHHNHTQSNFHVEFDWGNKFIRIITSSWGSRSCHSFIAKGSNPTDKWPEGTILMSSSWKAPAQNFARGNIYDEKSWNRVRWTGAQ